MFSLLALLDFHPKVLLTHFFPVSNPLHPHIHLFALPFRHFLFSSCSVFSQRIPPHAAEPTLPAAPHPAISQNKTSSPPPFVALLSLFLHTAFPTPLPSPPSPAPFFNSLSTLFHSSWTQQRTTRSPTSCKCPTHICPVLPFISKLIKPFSSIPLILCAYKQTVHSQTQTHSALDIQISHFTLLQYVTQFAHIPSSFRTRGTFRLWTADGIRAPSATTTAFFFIRYTLRVLTVSFRSFVKPRTSVLSRIQLFLRLRVPSRLLGSILLLLLY